MPCFTNSMNRPQPTNPNLILPPLQRNPSSQGISLPSIDTGVDALLIAAQLEHINLVPPMVCRSPSPSGPSGRRGRRGHVGPHGIHGGPARTPRAPRPVYTIEQDVSLLFFRDLIGLSWKKVERFLNRLYDENGRRVWPLRSESGLQSRYYRLIKVPAKDKKKLKREGRFPSVLEIYPTHRYWWMYATNYQAFSELLRACEGSHYHPRMLRALEERVTSLRLGNRTSEDPESTEAEDSDVASEAGEEPTTPNCPTLEASSPNEPASSPSPSVASPPHTAASEELFHYKPETSGHSDDDSRSLIDHSMEGLDDGSRRHTFRMRTSKL